MAERLLYNDLAQNILNGLEGKNKGIATGTRLIDDHLSGIIRGTYYLLGALKGTGKTAFIDAMIMTPILEHAIRYKLSNIKIIYYSFEIKFSIKLAKLLCRKLYLDYHKYIDVNTILSRGLKTPDREVLELADNYSEYFNSLGNTIIPIDTSMTGEELVADMFERSKEFGTWTTDDINGKFVSNDPEQTIIFIIDHIGLIKRDRFKDTKTTIDDVSRHIVNLRNKCNFSFIVTSQFNREQGTRERSLKKKYGPQDSDFKDTGNTQEDADVILALYAPYKYKAVEFLGYDIALLDKKFRSCHILKDRYGVTDIAAGYIFNGGVGHFTELPPSEEMDIQKYDYYAMFANGKGMVAEKETEFQL